VLGFGEEHASPNPPPTVASLLEEAQERLRSAGVPSPELDAELLLRHVLQWDRARIVTEAKSAVDQAAEPRFRALIDERATRKPLQHLTGRQWFWKHEFVVTPDVLIPRPETELIVEASLDLLRDVDRPLVVDVGTGSGCIALSIAAELPSATVVATDVSPAALRVAETNRRRLGLEGRVRLLEGDLLAPVRDLAGRVDLVASNPPYVGEDDVLEPEVRDHEPRLALFPTGGRAAVYARLAEGAAGVLKPGGFLVLEIGAGMEDEVRRLCESAAFHVTRVVPDLQGIPRTVVSRLSYPRLRVPS
jgi:release factor glutamine methyltransferase